MRVQIHANIRIRRIYFADRLYADNEMPNEFKLFLPGTTKSKEGKRPSKDDTDKKAMPAAAAPPAAEAIPAPPPTSEAPKEEEEKVQIEEAEVPSGAPPTPIESVADAEEKPPEVIDEVTVEEIPVESSEVVTSEKGGEAVESPTEAVEEVTVDVPTDAVLGEESPVEAPAAEEVEAAPLEAAEADATERIEGGGKKINYLFTSLLIIVILEGEVLQDVPEGESAPESPTTVADTIGDESPTETEATTAETTDVPTED